MSVKGVRRFGPKGLSALTLGTRFPGLEPLGGALLAGAAATTSVVQIPPRSLLVLLVTITGYGGADIASLRFNADSGANYWSRYITAAAGGTTLTNQQNVSQALARLWGTTATIARSATAEINNQAATTKVGNVRGQLSSGSAGTAPVIEFGGFEWVNTSAQITSITLVTAGGQTMLAGSGFLAFGANL